METKTYMTDRFALIEHLDLRAEIARVQAELIVFRKECLPAFLGGPVQDFLAEGMTEWLKRHIVAVAGRLSEWQDAPRSSCRSSRSASDSASRPSTPISQVAASSARCPFASQFPLIESARADRVRG
jgi:hypothetical protein